jgi:hypothetical protein
MKLLAVLFAVLVPFLAVRDAVHALVAGCLEGWGLALDMWQE